MCFYPNFKEIYENLEDKSPFVELESSFKLIKSIWEENCCVGVEGGSIHFSKFVKCFKRQYPDLFEKITAKLICEL